MNVAVVRRAEAAEVVERGRAAVDPVRQVMTVEEAAVSAAGEAAGGVASRECAGDGSRNRASTTADRERLTVGAFVEVYDAAVACESTRGLRGDAGAVGEAADGGGGRGGEGERVARDREHDPDRCARKRHRDPQGCRSCRTAPGTLQGAPT